MTTWREELEAEFTDKFSPLLGLSLSDFTIATTVGGLDREFDDGFGGANGPPFLAWSDDWVVYVHEYDGAESLHAVPRHPSAVMAGCGIRGKDHGYRNCAEVRERFGTDVVLTGRGVE